MLVSGIDRARAACDASLADWQRSRGRRGSVTVAAEPGLADDARAIVTAARTAWSAVNRPNALIAVPASEAGLAAMRELISFAVCVDLECRTGSCDYGRVLEAYMEGLAAASARGLDLGPIRAVATVTGLAPEEAQERSLTAWRRAAWLQLEDLGANRLSFVAATGERIPAA